MRSQKGAFRSYKQASASLFQSISFPRDLEEADVHRYLGLYARYERCAQLRTTYRDVFVPVDLRDRGHELAIAEAKRRVAECENILTLIFKHSSAKCEEGTHQGQVETTPIGPPSRRPRRRTRNGSAKATMAATLPAPDDTLSFLLRSKLQEMAKLAGELLEKVDATCNEHRLSFNRKTRLELAVEFTILCYKLRESKSVPRQRLHRHILDRPLPVPMVLEIGLRVVRDDLPFHRMTDALSTLITDFDTADTDATDQLRVTVMLLAADSIVQSTPKAGVLFAYIVKSLRELERSVTANVRISLKQLLGADD